MMAVFDLCGACSCGEYDNVLVVVLVNVVTMFFIVVAYFKLVRYLAELCVCVCNNRTWIHRWIDSDCLQFSKDLNCVFFNQGSPVRQQSHWRGRGDQD